MRGFEKKAGAAGRLTGAVAGALPFRKAKAYSRLQKIKAKNPKAFGPSGVTDFFRRYVREYRKQKASPFLGPKKALGWGMIGAGGAAYGSTKLRQSGEGQATGQRPYGRRGPTI